MGNKGTVGITQKQIGDIYIQGRNGNGKVASFIMVGIPRRSYYNYLARYEELKGKEDITKEEQKIVDLFESFEKGEAQAIERNTALIQTSAEKSWQAAAWWLERRVKKEFSATIRNEVTGQDGKPITVAHVEIPEEIRKRVQKDFEKRIADLAEELKPGQ